MMKVIPGSVLQRKSAQLFGLQPEEKISLTVMNKWPGVERGMNLQPV